MAQRLVRRAEDWDVPSSKTKFSIMFTLPGNQLRSKTASESTFTQKILIDTRILEGYQIIDYFILKLKRAFFTDYWLQASMKVNSHSPLPYKC